MANPLLDFFTYANWFQWKYLNKPGDRYHTFKAALNLFIQRRGETIVETGCQREKDDWGAGASTFIFGEVIVKYGGKLYTVDNNEEHLNRAKQFTKEFALNITYTLSDSVEYLKKFDKRIDLLYLDSLDYPLKELVTDPDEYKKQIQDAQNHCLNEIVAAWDKLHRDSIILLDDYDFEEGGKPKHVINFLLNRNWKILLEGKQCLMIT